MTTQPSSPPGPVRLLASSLILLLLVAVAVRAQDAEPSRILVGPVSARSSLAEDPFVQALPALVAEGIAGEGDRMASQVHDLAPGALEALGLEKGSLPDARLLGKRASSEALRSGASVRWVLLPEVSARKIEGEPGYEIGIRWVDLVRGEKGAESERALAGASAVDAVGRLAAAAAESAGAGSPMAGGAAGLSARLSSVPAALLPWARAREAWNTGDPGSAIEMLEESLRADPGFDRARVDLAWMRLEQSRPREAEALAAQAVEGGRLGPAARDEAAITRAAAAGDAAALLDLADVLASRPGGSPREPLARALGEIMQEDYPPAIALLDRPRFHHPNDPALLHLAGIAGLGSEDYYEAKARLGRAAAAWPSHEIIEMDLAEAFAREHDFEGAREVLERWRAGFKPGDEPGAGRGWSVENPPPHVRVATLHLLEGHPHAALADLSRDLVELETAGERPDVLVPILCALYEVQMWLLDDGSERQRQQMLNDARESLRLIDDWTTPEERARHPWIYDRMVARMRVREDRVEEARELRERILASSALEGYDPGAEAMVDAFIALKQPDVEAYLEASRRAVESRGSLLDSYLLLRAHAIQKDWRSLEEHFQEVERRIEQWSAKRRGDALLSSPMSSGFLPIIYWTAAVARINQGDANGARERFSSFLSYYREPDQVFMIMHGTAQNNGMAPGS